METHAAREPSAVTIAEVEAYLATVTMSDVDVKIDDLAANFARVRRIYDEANTRPGGYISGPTMMTLVDLAVWIAVFTRAGISPMAVTWELKINFLRPAIGKDLIADTHLHKFGRLSYASCDLYLDGEPDRLVAHATATYAVPQDDR